jgi:hypothetical protein
VTITLDETEESCPLTLPNSWIKLGEGMRGVWARVGLLALPHLLHERGGGGEVIFQKGFGRDVVDRSRGKLPRDELLEVYFGQVLGDVTPQLRGAQRERGGRGEGEGRERGSVREKSKCA